MTNLLKSRDITLLTKVRLVEAVVFPIAMYGCESWTIRKDEHWRIDAFELWCWRRLLRVSWTERRSNQSILKEISPEYSLGGLMLKLKLQYIGHLIWRTDSLKKTMMLGKTECSRRGWQRMRWLDGITNSMDMSIASSGSLWWTGRPGSPWDHKESDMTERLKLRHKMKFLEAASSWSQTVTPAFPHFQFKEFKRWSQHLWEWGPLRIRTQTS